MPRLSGCEEVDDYLVCISHFGLNRFQSSNRDCDLLQIQISELLSFMSVLNNRSYVRNPTTKP